MRGGAGCRPLLTHSIFPVYDRRLFRHESQQQATVPFLRREPVDLSIETDLPVFIPDVISARLRPGPANACRK